MQKILAPFLWIFCLVYIDDIIVYSKSFDEHAEHLERVLAAIARSGLTLLPPKCHLAYQSIQILGHMVSKKGIQLDPKKTEAIWNLPAPKNVTGVKKFYGSD